MQRRHIGHRFMVAAGAVLMGLAATAMAQSFPPHVQKHLDAATMNADGDKDIIQYIRRNQCFEVEDLNWRAWARTYIGKQVPLTQIFDDLWFIGDLYTGMYFLKTADGGLLLIDALNNSADADNYIIPALQQLNLPIRGAYITHGHGDHDGGMNRIRQVYGTNFPVYLGSGDVPGKLYSPTPIDSNNPAVQSITVGGTTIRVQATPGHTPGNQVSLIPVHQNGAPVLLTMNWRSAVPGSIGGSKLFVEGLEKTYRMIRDYGAMGTIHTHPVSDATLAALEGIIATGDRTRTPLVFGRERTQRAAVVARECAIARAAQIDATATWPIWRATKLEFVGKSPSSTQLAARLRSGWGPVANQEVTFQAASGAACVATTDQDGLATCKTLPTLGHREKVTASFAGTQSSEYLELPTSVEAVAVNMSCDVNDDGKVDRLDIAAIVGAVGKSVQKDDVKDADGDGKITAGDARACTVKCTKPQCAS